MQSLQNILRTFVKNYGLEGGMALNVLRSRWPEIVGQTISVHTCPDTLKGRILTLIVDTPQWMHHLGFFKEEIIVKLKKYDVDGIRFRVGRLPEKTKEACAADNIDLSEDDLRYLENTLASLKDEGLREKFRVLISHGLTKGRK